MSPTHMTCVTALILLPRYVAADPPRSEKPAAPEVVIRAHVVEVDRSFIDEVFDVPQLNSRVLRMTDIQAFICWQTLSRNEYGGLMVAPLNSHPSGKTLQLKYAPSEGSDHRPPVRKGLRHDHRPLEGSLTPTVSADRHNVALKLAFSAEDQNRSPVKVTTANAETLLILLNEKQKGRVRAIMIETKIVQP